jgi:hypothetical protein
MVSTTTNYTEEDIKRCFMTFPGAVHGLAANGENGAPLPSDRHSAIFSNAAGAGSHGLVGICDLVFLSQDNAVKALVEIKNPWMVSAQKIDEVLNS